MVQKQKIEKSVGLNIDNYSGVLRDVVWSVAVQHGAYGNVIKNALKNKDITKMSERDIINAIYDERESIDPKTNKLKYFNKVGAGWKEQLQERFSDERRQALEKLEEKNKFYMRNAFLYSLIIFGTLNCANIEKGKHDMSSVEISNQQGNEKLKSGKYGNVSVAVTGDTVTGVYEYYDKWNANAKQFTDINVFYFYGRLSNGQFPIKAGWPGDDLVSGSIRYGVGIKLSLEDQPNGYAAVDFVSTGYLAANTVIKNWIAIGIIKSEKSYLYKLPALEKTKVYVVSEDVVKILERTQGWYRVEYYPPTNSSKVFTGWIKDSDLYNVDPSKW